MCIFHSSHVDFIDNKISSVIMKSWDRGPPSLSPERTSYVDDSHEIWRASEESPGIYI